MEKYKITVYAQRRAPKTAFSKGLKGLLEWAYKSDKSWKPGFKGIVRGFFIERIESPLN